jgi:hypothetical protein
MTLVYCTGQNQHFVHRVLGGKATICTTWPPFELLAKTADCLVIVTEHLAADITVRHGLSRLRSLSPLVRPIIATRLLSKNVSLLDGLRFQPVEFSQLEAELPPAVAAAYGDTWATHMAHMLLDSCDSCEETEFAINVVFFADERARTDQQVAERVRAPVRHLRRCVQRDLGFSLAHLRRIARLIRSLEQCRKGMTPLEVADLFGVDEKTLQRNARNLLGLSLSDAREAGIETLSTRLLGLAPSTRYGPTRGNGLGKSDLPLPT